jgi:hypothetical protein
MSRSLIALLLALHFCTAAADAAKLKWSVTIAAPPGFTRTQLTTAYTDGTGGAVIITYDDNGDGTEASTRLLWITSSGRMRAETVIPAEVFLVRVTSSRVVTLDLASLLTTYSVVGTKVVRTDTPMSGTFARDATSLGSNTPTLTPDRLGCFSVQAPVQNGFKVYRYIY